MKQAKSNPTDYLRVDFHTHTNASPDSLLKPETLVKTAHRKGINRVVVTDHNKLEGALRAKELDPNYSPAYVGLSLVYGLRGDDATSAKYLKKAVNLLKETHQK